MSLFSWVSDTLSSIGSAVGSLFSSSSSSSSSYGGGSSSSHSYTSSTAYEPDKVKAAQIEAESKIKLANMEKERLEYMKQARLDIIHAETESRIAQEQARAQGFTVIAQAITAMQEKLTETAEKRLMIIEKASLQAVKDAEEFYSELSARIQSDNDKYTMEKLPALLEILAKYDDGSTMQKLYMRKIEEDIAVQAMHCTKQLEGVIVRQERIIDGILSAKERISEQAAQITAHMLESVNAKIEALDAGIPELPEMKEVPALHV